MSTPNFEIDKIRTEKPGHGPRLEIAPEIGKSRTESERGIIANVAGDLSAYGVDPWKYYGLIQAMEQYRLGLRGV